MQGFCEDLAAFAFANVYDQLEERRICYTGDLVMDQWFDDRHIFSWRAIAPSR